MDFMMRSIAVQLFSCCLLLGASQAVTAERITPERLWDLHRIGDAAVSPDGTQLAYFVTEYDVAENSGTTRLMLQPLESAAGKTPATTSLGFETPLRAAKATERLPATKGLNSLSWIQRPEGSRLLYIAPGPGEEGKPQAWMLDPAGGDPVQVTDIADGIGNLKPSPTGQSIAFTVEVKMDKEVSELYDDLPKADARIIDSLLFRHWDAWHDYAYSHVHVAPLDESGVAEPAVDLMKSLKADCPVPPFGGAEQFEFSPDGKELALTLKLVNNPAESTDTAIYLVSASGGSLRNITPGMPGYDMSPRYSPDGRLIAFDSMERGGFESDRNRIMVYDRTTMQTRDVTKGLDQTTHGATWSPDSKSLYFDSETRGTTQVYSIQVESSELQMVSKGWFNFSVVAPVLDGTHLLVRQQSMLRPTELALVDLDQQQLVTITDVNGSIYKGLDLPRIEERFFKATDGKMIQNWVILPPDYDESDDRQWPMLTYCQGGPQGQIGQWFSYRWNFHLMASKGYVVLAVNRRGLPGFGREWNDQISGDWGGQAMQDILASTDAMLGDPKIDRSRVAAIGASFGGYTAYWLMGNAGNRFCAIISHAGVYNLESMYGSTEELFFVNWDLGGPYWQSPEVAAKYAQFSPHRFAGNWKTPLLVIHGEKDFRVPITQGMEAFTAAQVQGVPSRFLYFPEEGHWILKPQNGVLWGRVFFDWIDRYCHPEE
ncbi:Prolyl tripeptidyl peptidase precursor [Roseimaritima multifibrata]|uniref:Prolyl tripeptidyl peptidase n=2 Tax=Roseimaritima multifibrata TaxID=1930274 RepID=A0A517MMY8_9BACT|nr:Prolyl tripeptidyl peptidase precursor [Roseimaritima multifibrata]